MYTISTNDIYSFFTLVLILLTPLIFVTTVVILLVILPKYISVLLRRSRFRKTGMGYERIFNKKHLLLYFTMLFIKQYRKAKQENSTEYFESEYKQDFNNTDGPLTPYYDTLQISPDASSKEIKDAYRTQISKWHPDKMATKSKRKIKKAESEAKKINTAYNELRVNGKL